MSFGSWLRDVFGGRASAPAPRTGLREGWFEALLDETRFLERWPDYAGVIARMDPIATNTVDVMAVALRRWDDPGSRLLLLVNLEWLEAHRDDAAGVLLHEIQHVRLGHLTTPSLHAVAYPRVMEIAMEISADEPITIPMPDHGFSLARFARFGVRKGQSTMERYRLLAAAYERGDLCMADFWHAQTRDTHRPRQGGFGGAGLGDLLDARADRATHERWRGERWGRGAPSSAAQLEQMKHKIAEHLRGERGGDDDPLARTQRRVAKEMERVVFDHGSGPRVDWRRVLREAFPRRRAMRPDYLRPNRRFPTRVGEIPGRVRRPPKPALLVAIDTSGSMTGQTLDRIAREVSQLRAFAKLTIIECDAAVHRVYALAGSLGPLVGGGDTDFAPAFDEARGARDVEGLVFFTDGKGQMPASPPAIPTLWVLTHGDPFLAEWGSVLRLPTGSSATIRSPS